jgi:hypothetical protein
LTEASPAGDLTTPQSTRPAGDVGQGHGAASRASAPAFEVTLRAECRRAFVRSEAVQPRRGVEGGREAAAQLAMLRP